MSDECPICLDKIKNPLQLSCEHIFCSSCILSYKNTLSEEKFIDPCLYGAPRCSCNNTTSCINRPCCILDTKVMKLWELKNPVEYREWTIDELVRSTSRTTSQTFSCPLCRSTV